MATLYFTAPLLLLFIGSLEILCFSDAAFLVGRRGSSSLSGQLGIWTNKGKIQTYRSVLQERLSSEEVRSRLQVQMEKLREKDRTSRAIAKEDLKIIHEDEDLILVDKPAGVLCMPTEEGIPSLVEAVYAHCQDKVSTDGSDGLVEKRDQMVVHRLGMDTSGLMVFAKTIEGMRGMNTLFRTRKITRQYEVLVCGHVAKDHGLINLPLMRDYQFPPFMRVSTDEHQRQLLDLDPDLVGKRLLEAPRASVTHYQVVARENFLGREELPVTRLTLTSITGRTHQLNVHTAAIGHPIVRDTVYGWKGEAAPRGGLQDDDDLAEEAEIRTNTMASEELQQRIAEAAVEAGMSMCVHAKEIKFKHPVTKEEMSFTSPPPF